MALTYSAMLSRGLENVKGDADEALGGATLIDRHGYATQELVNLLLVGRGHSNVFDGTRTLDDNSGTPLSFSSQPCLFLSDVRTLETSISFVHATYPTEALYLISLSSSAPSPAPPSLLPCLTSSSSSLPLFLGKSDDAVTLRGIPSRGLVGFLSLHEAYRYTEVGAHLKSPTAPVWVVCSESHYSVLFLPPHATAGEESGDTFDLHYYDGLANQQESIVLTIDRHPSKPPPAGPDDDKLIPPLDLVVRTKWAGAAVKWSGDPIL